MMCAIESFGQLLVETAARGRNCQNFLLNILQAFRQFSVLVECIIHEGLDRLRDSLEISFMVPGT
jgi:hypothetical protein